MRGGMLDWAMGIRVLALAALVRPPEVVDNIARQIETLEVQKTCGALDSTFQKTCMHTVSSIMQKFKSAEHSIEGWRNSNLVHRMQDTYVVD